jgi:hypothetical protein
MLFFRQVLVFSLGCHLFVSLDSLPPSILVAVKLHTKPTQVPIPFLSLVDTLADWWIRWLIGGFVG